MTHRYVKYPQSDHLYINYLIFITIQEKIFKFGTAEKKLLIVFCYYVVLTVFALTAFTMFTRNAPRLVSSIQRYFICERRGHDPNNPCSRSGIADGNNHFMDTLSFLLVAFFPVVNLVYAVNVRELKELWMKCFQKNHMWDSFKEWGNSINN